MKKIISFLILVNLFFCLSAAELTARFVTGEAAKKDSLEESLSYLKDQVAKMNLPAEKRATYVFIATLEEQMALYDQAQKSYAQAASIAARAHRRPDRARRARGRPSRRPQRG